MAPVRRALFDGVLIGAALGIVSLTSLLINPMAWISNYPPDIQAAVTGSERSTTAFQVLVAGALLGSVGRVNAVLAKVGSRSERS